MVRASFETSLHLFVGARSSRHIPALFRWCLQVQILGPSAPKVHIKIEKFRSEAEEDSRFIQDTLISGKYEGVVDEGTEQSA